MRFALIIALLVYGSCHSQEMRIGLLRSLKLKNVAMEFHKGVYHVYADTTFIGDLDQGEKLGVSLSGDKVALRYKGVAKGSFSKIMILQDTSHSSLYVRATSPASKLHTYQGSFECSSEGNRIRLVNVVDMNSYLAGVIESEGGGGRHLEYYKVQALMSRTYAFQNKKRHAKEGFELCDNVHCQAYHNMLKRTPKIRTAVEETDGEVIVDHANKMLTTYFSANCGGQTCDASHVWNNSVAYCESFLDTFCIHTKQATWVKYIERTKWLSYLSKEYGFDSNNDQLLDLAFSFKQEQRKAFYIHPSLGIPMRDLRKKFRLKSTFFDVSLDGDRVKLEGRGFGHGVGLCQEGAMNMAKAGFSYKQIATFYFTGVTVLNYERLDFFNQENSEL